MSIHLSRATGATLALCPIRVLLTCVFAAAGGCAAPAPSLTVDLRSQGQSFTQQFSAAYASHDSGGDTDLVLVDQACEQALDGHPDGCPIRQVMHIRVMWQPLRDIKADHPTASNATIHWYVMGNSPAHPGDILEYDGTGYVVLDSGDGITELTIRNASLRPIACRGELCDPLGASALHGTIRAHDNRQRVRDVLLNVRTAIAAARNPTNHVVTRAGPESPSSSAR